MTQPKTPRFVTIAELVRMLSVPGRKPGVTANTVRMLIYRRFKNGLDAYVWRSAPTRWLIDVDGFLGWLRSGTEALDRKERAAIADFWRDLNEALDASENTSRTVIPLTEARAPTRRLAQLVHKRHGKRRLLAGLQGALRHQFSRAD